MNNPKISIICPVYNAASCIGQTLDSLLKQTFRDFEILCVDDGSKDNSVEILNQYAKNDARIRVFQKPNGKTAARVVSFALPYCRGKYYFFVSHDDLFSEDLLETLYARAEETGAEKVICDVLLWHENEPEKDVRLGAPNGDHSVILNGEEAFKLMIDGWKIPGAGLKELKSFRESGFYDRWFNGDEYSGWLHTLRCKKVAFASGTYFYRQTPTAVTKKISPLLFETLCTDIELLEIIEKLDQKKWNAFLVKRMKSLISELRTAHGRLKNKCDNFTNEERIRTQKIIKDVESKLFDMICRATTGLTKISLIIRFVYKLKIS